MRRSLITRVLAMMLAGTAAIAAPGSALAHGESHHHAAQHQHDRHDGDAYVERSASAPDHGHEHQHPQLDGTTRTRVIDSALVVAPSTAAPEVTLVRVRAAVVRGDEPRGGDSSRGSPPRLRAPPTR